jgi:uncharacterized protein (TIGR03067 family)
MRCLLIGAFAPVFMAALCAAGVDDAVTSDVKKSELKKLDGTWQLVSAVENGKPAPEGVVKKIRVVIKEGKHTVYFGDDVVVKEIPFDLDPSKSPKTTLDTLPEGKTIRGIYKLEGDKLTSCAAEVGKEGPTEFASEPGSGHTLRVFQRVKVMAVAFGQAQSERPKSKPADVGPGRVAWFDITTTDLSKSKEFYGKLFDWTFNPVQGTDKAVQIVAGGSEIGTIRVAEGKISSFNGVVYIQVPSIQESCKKAKELGGTVVPGFPFDLPNAKGAIGLVSDPAGHPVGMYSRTPLVSQKPASK